LSDLVKSGRPFSATIPVQRDVLPQLSSRRAARHRSLQRHVAPGLPAGHEPGSMAPADSGPSQIF